MADHNHNHAHDRHNHSHSTPANLSTAFVVSIVLNSAFVVIELGYGFTSNSVALIADATHNLGDVLGLTLGFVAFKLASKIPNQKFTYGYKSSTILATLVSGSLLMIAVGGIIVEAFQKLLHPESVNGLTVIVIASIGVVINAISAYLLSKGNKDLNIKSAFIHLASDAIVSIGVVVAGIVVLTTGFLYTDPIVSLAIGIVIFISTLQIFKEALSLSMLGVPKGVDIQKVKIMLQNLPNVVSIHDLHIWAMSTSENALTCHLVIQDKKSVIDLNHLSEELHNEFRIDHPTIQVETIDEHNNCKLLSEAVV